MTTEQIRLECYRLAVVAERTRAGIRKPAATIAAKFVGFCEPGELFFTALKMAVEAANTRAPIEVILASAQAFVDFAKPPEPEPDVIDSRPTSKGGKRGKR